MDKLTCKNAVVDLLGRSNIPAHIRQICHGAFDRNPRLRSVHVPGTVKIIGSRAFADCENLETVVLEEGIEQIDGNAFTGCASLRRLVLPDSLKHLDGWAFYNFTGLQTPAYSRSGTVLYCYPSTAREPVFTVPDQVTRINNCAFLNNPYLQQVNLPEGLTVLERRTFLEVGIRRVVIPASVQRIEEGAFWGCQQLEEVVLLGKDTHIEKGAFLRCPWNMKLTTVSALPFDERLHLFGYTFLQPIRLEYLTNAHWEQPGFLDLARRCGTGSAEAMWEMADYFSRLGTEPFHICAANFWRYRAYQHGCAPASLWIQEQPEKRMASVLPETLVGSFEGRRLRDAGFLFFDPERSYSLAEKDAQGVVEVRSWCGEDGPDEDGYGLEEYYDWWFLDEHLNPIPGVAVIHSFSRIDKRANGNLFRAHHDKAAAFIKKK